MSRTNAWTLHGWVPMVMRVHTFSLPPWIRIELSNERVLYATDHTVDPPVYRAIDEDTMQVIAKGGSVAHIDHPEILYHLADLVDERIQAGEGRRATPEQVAIALASDLTFADTEPPEQEQS